MTWSSALSPAVMRSHPTRVLAKGWAPAVGLREIMSHRPAWPKAWVSTEVKVEHPLFSPRRIFLLGERLR